MIEKKLESFGFNGHVCLLRTICEASGNEILEVNGVVGNFVHTLLT